MEIKPIKDKGWGLITNEYILKNDYVFKFRL